jgi:GNAT superfamily N-acetyltransferase
MAAGEFTIRVMSRADLDRTLDWAAAEGWNPGVDDARAFHAADPLGFFVGWQGDEPAATISVVNYDASFGFLGLYIARPEFRGQGLGFALWQDALRRRPADCIGLDGVVAQQANYARSGFALAYRNIRFGGRAPCADAIHAAARDAKRTPMMAAYNVPFAAIAAYDRLCFPAPRAAFLSAWLDRGPESPSRGDAAVAERDGRIAGFGAIRQSREGFKIGPLFADDEAAADALFRRLAGHAPAGQPFFLDIPEPNRAALRLAERYAMKPVFETARMYTGNAPAMISRACSA